MTPLKILRVVERTFLVCVLLTMVALYFCNVLIREFGGPMASNFAWIEEAVRLLNLFMVFGALGLALERGRHVSIDTLREKLPQGLRTLVLKAIDVAGLLFCLYVVVLGGRLVDFVLGTGQRSPTLDIPMGWIYMAPVVGFSLLGLRYALSLFNLIDRFQGPGASRRPTQTEAAQS